MARLRCRTYLLAWMVCGCIYDLNVHVGYVPSLGGHPDMSPQRPQILSLHHIKFAVSNLDVSLAWYERVLGAHRINTLDHIRTDGSRYAAICQLEEWSRLFLELRQNPDQARKSREWNIVTLSVAARRDLVSWSRWLDEWRSTHSPIFAGRRGWLMVFEVGLAPLQPLYTLCADDECRIPTGGESASTLASHTMVARPPIRMITG